MALSHPQESLLISFTTTPQWLRPITPQMKAFMARVRQKVDIATVGGSDMAKQIEQMGPNRL